MIALVFATEISWNRIVGCDVALWRGPVATDGVCRYCYLNRALVRSVAAGVATAKAFLYYDTINSASWSLSDRSRSNHGPLCGTSHMTARTCDNLKNLAFAIEPQANPIRPTLRDGH